VIGQVALENDLPGDLPPARASRHLRQELEGPLRGSEVGYPEADVGVHHPDQRDPREVVTLGDHLRPDKDVELPRLEGGERPRHHPAAPRTVTVEPLDAGRRQRRPHRLHHPLRPIAGEPQVRAPAGWAGGGWPRLVPAVVTERGPCALMEGEGDRAVGASRLEPALAVPDVRDVRLDGEAVAFTTSRFGDRVLVSVTCPLRPGATRTLEVLAAEGR